jgi:hypothetical protein
MERHASPDTYATPDLVKPFDFDDANVISVCGDLNRHRLARGIPEILGHRNSDLDDADVRERVPGEVETGPAQPILMTTRDLLDETVRR